MRTLHGCLDELLQQMRSLSLQRRTSEALVPIDRHLSQADPAWIPGLSACRTTASWHAEAMQGRYATGLEQAIAAIEALAHLGFERHLDTFRVALAFAMGLSGNLETALQWVVRVADAAQVRGDRVMLRVATGDRAALHCLAGDYEAADRQFESVDALWRPDPDAGPAANEGWRRSTHLNNWAFCKLMWARSIPEDSVTRRQVAAQALQVADAALPLTPGPAGSRWAAWSLSNRGQALTLLGRWDDAEHAFRACEPMWAVNHRIAAVAMAGHATLMAETGRFDEGRRLLDRAHAIAPEDLLDTPLDLVMEARVLLETRARNVDGLAHWSAEQHRRLKAQYRARQAAAMQQNELLSSIERERAVERHKASTALQRAGAAYEAAAWHDLVTGLPNRTLGRIRLQQALDLRPAGAPPLAVACAGIDRFKEVNARHGQAIGDELLRLLGERLTQALRRDDLVCRLSGDQFMILLPSAQSSQDVDSLCERLQACTREPFTTGGVSVRLSLSVGVALGSSADPPVDADLLMAHADIALMEAKKLGTNRRAVYTPQMSARRLQQAQTREARQLALHQGEFELRYQPKVELGSGRLVGSEALLRWRRPDGRLASPAEFLDVAEDSGLIVPIGRWALIEACRQAAAWETAWQRGLSVAVNLSAVQFRHGRVVEDIDEALRLSGLDPRLLEVELTESMLLRDDEHVAATLAQLKVRGVQRSIDDFGTGYSSLAYLKRFAIDKLKIDRSFVEHMQRDARDRGIVRAMIDIARSLKIRTVAEGVEDESLAQALHEMGCDEAQGYLYARPMAPLEFERWMQQVTVG